MNKPPVDEPAGYSSTPSFVKSRPENNAHYLAQFEGDPWYEVLVALDEDLEQIVPGYNIAQIKEKFGDLRYYVDYPTTATPGDIEAADELIEEAEIACYEIDRANKIGR